MVPVRLLADYGVEALVAGGMGRNLLMGFMAAGIEVYRPGRDDSVGAAVQALLAGEAEKLIRPAASITERPPEQREPFPCQAERRPGPAQALGSLPGVRGSTLALSPPLKLSTAKPCWVSTRAAK